MKYLDLVILGILALVIFYIFFKKVFKEGKINPSKIKSQTKEMLRKQIDAQKKIVEEIKQTYKNIWECFSSNNTRDLGKYLSTSLFKDFYDEIKDNQKNKILSVVKIENIKKVEIEKIKVFNNKLEIYAKIISIQDRYKEKLNSKRKIRSVKEEYQDNCIFEKNVMSSEIILKEIL